MSELQWGKAVWGSNDTPGVRFKGLVSGVGPVLLCGALLHLLFLLAGPVGFSSTSAYAAAGDNADLVLTTTDSPDPAVKGGTLTYTLTVTNNGPDGATGVVLTDTLHPSVAFGSATASQGSCSHAAGVVTCPLDNVASGANATVTLEVTLNLGGVITNSAVVTSVETDPDPANNSDSEQTAVPVAAAVYLSNVDGDTVSAIDPRSNAVVTHVSVGNEPRNLAPNPAGTRIYVPNRNSDTLSVVDTATNALVATVTDNSFAQPYAVAVTPDGSEVWVANKTDDGGGYGPGSVSVVSTSTNQVIDVIHDNESGCISSPEGIAMNPVKNEAYVASRGSDFLCVIDRSAKTILQAVDVAGEPRFAVVTPDGRYVYVSSPFGGVTKVDTDNSYSTVDVQGIDGRNMAITEDGKKVYVATQGTDLGIIDTTTDNVTFLDFGGVEGWGSTYAVTVVPGTNLGFVTDEDNDQVYVFDTSTDTEFTGTGLPIIDSGFATPRAITSVALAASAATGPEIILGGGGCSASAGGRGLDTRSVLVFLAILALPMVVLRLARGRGGRALPFFLLLMVAAPIVSHAFDAHIFQPQVNRDGFVAIESTGTLDPHQAQLSLFLDYGKDPLKIQAPGTEFVLAKRQFAATWTGGVGLTDAFQVSASIPYVLSSDGLRLDKVSDIDSSNLGDLTLSGRYRITPKGGEGFNVAVSPFVVVDTGDSDNWTGNKGFAGGLNAVFDTPITKQVKLALNAGFSFQEDERLTSTQEVGNTVSFGFGLLYSASADLDLSAELYGFTATSDFFDENLTPLEVDANLSYRFLPNSSLVLGGGTGLTEGIGSPDWRAYAGIRIGL